MNDESLLEEIRDYYKIDSDPTLEKYKNYLSSTGQLDKLNSVNYILKQSNNDISSIINGGMFDNMPIVKDEKLVEENVIDDEGKPLDVDTSKISETLSSGIITGLQTIDSISKVYNAIYIQSEFAKMKSLANSLTKSTNDLKDFKIGDITLLDETKQRLGSKIDDFITFVSRNVPSISDNTYSISQKISKRMGDANDIDRESEQGAQPLYFRDLGNGTKKQYNDDTSPETPVENPPENFDLNQEQTIEETPQEQENVNPLIIENEMLIKTSLGSFAFQTPITLFLTIGGEQIQSSSEVEYGILGIERVDGVLYCKVIDKKTGKIYYAKLEDLNVDEENDLKVIHTKGYAALLSSNDIGGDSNARLVQPDSYYLVQDSQEINNIKFTKVLDGTDGNSYYVTPSESVEELSLGQIVEGTNVEINPNVTDNTDINIEISDETFDSLNENTGDDGIISYNDSDVEISETSEELTSDDISIDSTDNTESLDTSTNSVENIESLDKVPDVSDDDIDITIDDDLSNTSNSNFDIDTTSENDEEFEEYFDDSE